MAVVLAVSLGVAVFVGAIIWFVMWIAGLTKKKPSQGAFAAYDEVGRAFGLPTTAALYTPQEITVGERRVKVQMFGGGKNGPPMLRVMLPVDPLVSGAAARRDQGVYRDTAKRRVTGELPVLFRKEKPLDAFGKRIGLNVEHQTGDAAFDAEVYIESDATTADLEALLSDTTTRQAVHQLLGGRAMSVELFRGASDVRLTMMRPTAADAENIAPLVERLAVIAENLPSFERSPVGRAAPLRTTVAAIVGMGGAMGALVFGAVSATRWEILTAGVLGKCVLAGFVAWAVLSVIAFVTMRGKSDALRAYGFVLFGGLVVYPAIGAGLGSMANATLDEGPATVHVAPITRRYTTTSKNNTTYHVVLQSWRPDRDGIEVTVTRDAYMNAIGASLRVTTRPGRFGWEWLDRSVGFQLIQPKSNGAP
ncbi:MAG: hypothetical protein U0441_29160 [Polyangiaceae bacterium]